MTRLSITNFSCIDEAVVDLSTLTVLIGPQASGKSVVSKLLHFFIGVIQDIYGFDPDLKIRTITEYSDNIIKDFEKSFPSSAWGGKPFAIAFSTGRISVDIKRSKPRRNSVGKLSIVLSDYIKDVFMTVQDEVTSTLQKVEESKDRTILGRDWDLTWRIYQRVQNKLQKDLGEEFVRTQFFVPAGRSFFTSMGKAVVAFEHGGFLDPLTIRFGKYFLAMRDRSGTVRYMYPRPGNEKLQKELAVLRDRLAEQLFSGTIKIDKNEEYIESSDGRKIPFSIMSSGQQELLPLWLTVNEVFDAQSPYTLIYIEEPEAHLFPSAQGQLTEYLSTLLGSAPGQKMLLTTHSPYILAKINNLLKAGAMANAASKKIQADVGEIIPRRAWLRPKTTTAYAIVDRRLVSIMGEDGLIDGEYLDQVSGDISVDFNRLLEVEYVS